MTQETETPQDPQIPIGDDPSIYPTGLLGTEGPQSPETSLDLDALFALPFLEQVRLLRQQRLTNRAISTFLGTTEHRVGKAARVLIKSGDIEDRHETRRAEMDDLRSRVRELRLKGLGNKTIAHALNEPESRIQAAATDLVSAGQVPPLTRSHEEVEALAARIKPLRDTDMTLEEIAETLQETKNRVVYANQLAMRQGDISSKVRTPEEMRTLRSQIKSLRQQRVGNVDIANIAQVPLHIVEMVAGQLIENGEISPLKPSRERVTHIDEQVLQLRNEGLTRGDIVESTGLPEHTVDNSLRRLLRKGLIERKPQGNPKLQVNERFFEEWSPPLSYYLGLFAADGFIQEGKHGYKALIALGEGPDERAVLESLARDIGVNVRQRKGTFPVAVLSVSRRAVVEKLKEYGFTHTKKEETRFPDVPNEHLPHFVRGFFDGDGDVEILRKKSGIQVNVTFGNPGPNFLETLSAKLADQTGLPYEQIQQERTREARRLTYRLRYAQVDAAKLYEFMYGNDEGLCFAQKKEELEEGLRLLPDLAGEADDE